MAEVMRRRPGYRPTLGMVETDKSFLGVVSDTKSLAARNGGFHGMAVTFWSSCLQLPSGRMTAVHHHTLLTVLEMETRASHILGKRYTN